MRKKIFWMLIIFFSINLILSIYLEFRDLNTAIPICGISNENGCLDITKSDYAYTFGIKNTILGIAASMLFIILTIKYYIRPHKHLRLVKNISLAVAMIFALRFLYIQFFILKEICPYCLIIDALTVASFFVFYFETKNAF